MNVSISRRRWSVWLSLALAALTIAVIGAHAQARDTHTGWTKNLDAASCSLNGIPLYGKVQIVESFPDLKVKKVTSFPDLKVQWVESFPDQCGKWQEVSSFPDLTIQYVESFPDLAIEDVTSFPGLP